MGFENIIGNQSMKQLLLHAINTSNLLHSYMFVGIDGIGKCLTAKEFAKLILDNPSDLSNHPDFMMIMPEDGKSLKIEQIRYLQEKIAEKPIASSKKVYIIDDSDSMTTEAQNCLLKTLEEPPEYAIIILVLSNENKMLTTIKSRCTKLLFTPLTSDEIKQYFVQEHLDVPNETLLKVCNGSIGKCLQMQDQMSCYEQIDMLLERLDQLDMIDVWKSSDVLYGAKDSIYSLLEYINIILLDKLKQTNDMRYGQCIEIVEQTRKRLTTNANYDMCIDSLLLKVWEEFHEEYRWN